MTDTPSHSIYEEIDINGVIQFILRNKGLIRIFNKDNFKRKECVYLPARAFFKALKLKKNNNL